MAIMKKISLTATKSCGLTVKRSYSALRALTAILMAVCCACGVSSSAPLDDAYYWPDKKTQNIQSTQITPNTQSSPNTPAIEIINSQDTTVTIRVKK